MKRYLITAILAAGFLVGCSGGGLPDATYRVTVKAVPAYGSGCAGYRIRGFDLGNGISRPDVRENWTEHTIGATVELGGVDPGDRVRVTVENLCAALKDNSIRAELRFDAELVDDRSFGWFDTLEAVAR